MAWSFISGTTGSGTANSITTSSIDTTGASLIVVGMSRDDSTQPTGLSDNKNNQWTHIITVVQGATRSSLFYTKATNVGAGHTFTNDRISNFCTLYVGAFSGEAGEYPFLVDKTAANNISSTTLSTGSITPTYNNELIVTHLGISGAGTPISIDSGFTEIGEIDFNTGVYYGGSMAYIIQTTASAVNPTWTRTNSNPMATTMASFALYTENKSAWLKA